jgi:predicted Fe-Mo cluster-binding NifX family protein
MRIVVTTTTPDLDSPVDPRFGRGAYFVLVDADTMEWQAHPNPAAAASGGAGIRAAQFVAEQKADGVISGDFGPNAHQALTAAGIGMYLFGGSASARQAVERFKAGELETPGGSVGQGRRPRG